MFPRYHVHKENQLHQYIGIDQTDENLNWRQNFPLTEATMWPELNKKMQHLVNKRKHSNFTQPI